MGRTARFDLDQANGRNRRYLAACARVDEGPESTLLSRSEQGRLANAWVGRDVVERLPVFVDERRRDHDRKIA